MAYVCDLAAICPDVPIGIVCSGKYLRTTHISHGSKEDLPVAAKAKHTRHQSLEQRNMLAAWLTIVGAVLSIVSAGLSIGLEAMQSGQLPVPQPVIIIVLTPPTSVSPSSVCPCSGCARQQYLPVLWPPVK